MDGENKGPDIGLSSKYHVKYTLWRHPANWHQSMAIEPVVISQVNVSRHAKICTNRQ